MSDILLSVLIPSVPSRAHQAAALFAKLSKMAAGYPAEVLMFSDNKRRCVAAKRNALLDESRGAYVAFVDDDDDVEDCYFDAIIPALSHGCSVVTFQTTCQLNGGPIVRVEHSVEYKNEQYNPNGFKRTPWMCHPWRRAANVAFPIFLNIPGNEDGPWVEAMLRRRVGLQCQIPGLPLYHYRYNHETTEASR